MKHPTLWSTIVMRSRLASWPGIGGVSTQILRKGRFAAGEDAEAVNERFERQIARTTSQLEPVQVGGLSVSDKVSEPDLERPTQRREIIRSHLPAPRLQVGHGRPRPPGAHPLGKVSLGPAAPCTFTAHVRGDPVPEAGHSLRVRRWAAPCIPPDA